MAARAAPPRAPAVPPPHRATPRGNGGGFFAGAPFTKLLFWALLASFVLHRSSHVRSHLRSVPFVADGLLPRPLVSYRTVSEFAACGSLLVAGSRKFERQMGSVRIVKLAVLCGTVAFWLGRAARYGWYLNRAAATGTTTTERYGSDDDDDGADGSIGITGAASVRFVDVYAGALLYLYRAHAPRVYPRFVSLPGGGGDWHGSEKVLPYLWFLVGCWTATMAANAANATAPPSPGTVLLAVVLPAVLAGMVVGAAFPALSRWVVVPNRVTSLVASRIGTALQPPPRMWVPTFGSGGLGGGAAAGGHYAPYRPNPVAHHAAAAAAAAAALAPVRPAAHSTSSFGAAAAAAAEPRAVPVPRADPDAVETLVGMGFERDRVVRALVEARNDVPRAADLLLSGA